MDTLDAKSQRIASLERLLVGLHTRGLAANEDIAELSINIAQCAQNAIGENVHLGQDALHQVRHEADVAAISLASVKVERLHRLILLLRLVQAQGEFFDGMSEKDREVEVVDAILTAVQSDPSGPWACLLPVVMDGVVAGDDYAMGIHQILALRKELRRLKKHTAYWKTRARCQQGTAFEYPSGSSASLVQNPRNVLTTERKTVDRETGLKPSEVAQYAQSCSMVGSLPSFVRSTDIILGSASSVLDDTVRNVSSTPSMLSLYSTPRRPSPPSRPPPSRPPLSFRTNADRSRRQSESTTSNSYLENRSGALNPEAVVLPNRQPSNPTYDLNESLKLFSTPERTAVRQLSDDDELSSSDESDEFSILQTPRTGLALPTPIHTSGCLGDTGVVQRSSPTLRTLPHSTWNTLVPQTPPLGRKNDKLRSGLPVLSPTHNGYMTPTVSSLGRSKGSAKGFGSPGENHVHAPRSRAKTPTGRIPTPLVSRGSSLAPKPS